MPFNEKVVLAVAALLLATALYGKRMEQPFNERINKLIKDICNEKR